MNFETFSNEDFLEVESLGPLAPLDPGASVSHTETWQLFRGVPHVETEDDADAACPGAGVVVVTERTNGGPRRIRVQKSSPCCMPVFYRGRSFRSGACVESRPSMRAGLLIDYGTPKVGSAFWYACTVCCSRHQKARSSRDGRGHGSSLPANPFRPLPLARHGGERSGENEGLPFQRMAVSD